MSRKLVQSVKHIQHGPLGVAYHHRDPISTIRVAKIKAHATVPGLFNFTLVIFMLEDIWIGRNNLFNLQTSKFTIVFDIENQLNTCHLKSAYDENTK
jgi:hypothetical protein